MREYAQVKPVEEAVNRQSVSVFRKDSNRVLQSRHLEYYKIVKSWEEGREEGIEEGIKKGKQELFDSKENGKRKVNF